MKDCLESESVVASEMLGSAAAPSDGDDGLLLGFGLMVA